MESLSNTNPNNRNRNCCLIIPNRLSSLLVAERVIESLCLQEKTGVNETSAIVLAMSEVLCNIIQHGFAKGEESEIVLETIIVENTLTIIINDRGVAVPANIVEQYEKKEVCMPCIDTAIEDLPDSGWGVNILLTTATNVVYTRTSLGNQLVLEFKIAC